jgi:hypothetical protein
VVEYYERDGRVMQIISTRPIEDVYQETRSYFLDMPTPPPKTAGAAKHRPLTNQNSTIGGKNPLPPISSDRPKTTREEQQREIVRAVSVVGGSTTVAGKTLKRGGAWDNIVFVLGKFRNLF